MVEKSRMDKAFEKRDIYMIMDSDDMNKCLVSKYRYYPATDEEFGGIGYYRFVMYNESTTPDNLISAYNDSVKLGRGFGINIGLVINVELAVYNANKEIIDSFVSGHDIEKPHFIERRGKPQIKWDHKQSLTSKQVQCMIDICERDVDHFMITTLYGTGMRIGELVAMRKHWYTIKDGVMSINIPREEGDFNTKTPAGARVIYITDKIVISVIEEWFNNHESYGLKRAMAWKICTAIAKKADIEQIVTPHTLRHSRISRWVWEGKLSQILIQKMAGHADMSITMNVYTHQNKDEIPAEILNVQEYNNETDAELESGGMLDV